MTGIEDMFTARIESLLLLELSHRLTWDPKDNHFTHPPHPMNNNGVS